MDERLSQRVAELRSATVGRCIEEWQGVGRFHDQTVVAVCDGLLRLGVGGEADDIASLAAQLGVPPRFVVEILRLAERQHVPRLVDPEERLVLDVPSTRARRGASLWDLSASQGVDDVVSWRGRPLFKTAWEVALYPMLMWELAPAAVLELGSGTGASAVWFADIPGREEGHRVVSIDLVRPDVDDPRVDFVEGDLTEPEAVLDDELMASLERPLLVVEDAHVNVSAVLDRVDLFLESGDVLVVEDSIGKRQELRDFVSARPGRFVLDRRYTDMFGENVTSAVDSVLVRS